VYTGCCTTAERAYATPISVLLFAGPEADTLEGCLAFYEAFVPSASAVDFLEEQLASGRARWDASKLGPCLAEWSGCGIPRVRRAGVWGEGCAEPPVVSARAIGEACRSVVDCVDGTCEDGVCVAPPAVGEACGLVKGQPLACAHGAYCDPLTSRCAALVEAGAPCTAKSACATAECHGKPSEAGVCSAATICDGDGTNDPALVLGTCSKSEPGLGSIACELGTSSVWRCVCDDGQGTTSTCEVPFDRAQQSQPEGACTNFGCCAP
jgi:hypothetical protein